LAEETEVFWKKNSQCQFIHKFQFPWDKIEPGSSRWKTKSYFCTYSAL
jgi:hypothetical protein